MGHGPALRLPLSARSGDLRRDGWQGARGAVSGLRRTAIQPTGRALPAEDIEAFGGLVDEPLQILGKQVSVLDKVLCRFPYLFQVHISARVAVDEFSGSSSPLLRLFIVKDRGANLWMSVALPSSEPSFTTAPFSVALAQCCGSMTCSSRLGFQFWYRTAILPDIMAFTNSARAASRAVHACSSSIDGIVIDSPASRPASAASTSCSGAR